MARMKDMTAAMKPRATWSTPGRPQRRGLFSVSLARPNSKTHFESAGITVIATTRDSRTETEIATAMSRKSWPTSSSITRIGMKTMTVVSAETRTAPQTSLAPR